MTVNQLHKKLSKMIADGSGKRYVSIDKSTFSHVCENDGVTILNAHDCRIARVHVGDEDGGAAENADGSERYTTVAILFGSGDEKTLGVKKTKKVNK
jgi:hypothetical protein